MNLSFYNSLTKYPSIPTWHAMGERGRLTESTACATEGPWRLTEKVDGTNCRIVLIGRPSNQPDVLIGSREDLLWARGDRLHNPAMGIVDAVRKHVEPLLDCVQPMTGAVVAIYGEVYGHKIGGNAKNYTADGSVGFRVFDMRDYQRGTVERCASMEPGELAAWRENGGIGWRLSSDMRPILSGTGLDMVPALGSLTELPAGLTEARDLLAQVLDGGTRCGFDVRGKPEGVVARTSDRSRIVKLRIEDYERTLRGRS